MNKSVLSACTNENKSPFNKNLYTSYEEAKSINKSNISKIKSNKKTIQKSTKSNKIQNSKFSFKYSTPYKNEFENENQKEKKKLLNTTSISSNKTNVENSINRYSFKENNIFTRLYNKIPSNLELKREIYRKNSDLTPLPSYNPNFKSKNIENLKKAERVVVYLRTKQYSKSNFKVNLNEVILKNTIKIQRWYRFIKIKKYYAIYLQSMIRGYLVRNKYKFIRFYRILYRTMKRYICNKSSFFLRRLENFHENSLFSIPNSQNIAVNSTYSEISISVISLSNNKSVDNENDDIDNDYDKNSELKQYYNRSNYTSNNHISEKEYKENPIYKIKNLYKIKYKQDMFILKDNIKIWITRVKSINKENSTKNNILLMLINNYHLLNRRLFFFNLKFIEKKYIEKIKIKKKRMKILLFYIKSIINIRKRHIFSDLKEEVNTKYDTIQKNKKNERMIQNIYKEMTLNYMNIVKEFMNDDTIVDIINSCTYN